MKSLALACALMELSLTLFSSICIAQRRRPPVKHVAPRVVKNCPASGLTDAEVADILAAHNKARQEVKVAPLAWDCTLGAAAASWAKQSIFGHSGTSYGENIFVSADTDDKVTKAVDKWEDEEHNWNNKTATCESGKTCTITHRSFPA